MSEFTQKGLLRALEQKGYTGLFLFISHSFEFKDRLDCGLERVQKAFDGLGGPGRFNMYFYPVWEEQMKPYVSAALGGQYNEGKFQIDHLYLSYWNGKSFSPGWAQTLDKPTLSEIPTKSELRRKLSKLTGGIQPKITKKRRLKL